MSAENTSKSTHYSAFFALLCTAQVLFWTIFPAISRPNLPFDTVEGIAWGQQWALGYDKHPPLAAWLCQTFTALFNVAGWPVYLFGQLAVITTYFAVWRLARHFLNEKLAIISVCLLTPIWYYTIATPKINPTTLMTPLWALTMLTLYHALNGKYHWRYWLITGLLTGLCMITKYQSAILVIALLGTLAAIPRYRIHITSTPFVASLLLALAVWSPNLYWNAQHQWIEIQYALGRAGDYQTIAGGWWSHLYWPSYFLLQQIGSCLPMLIIAIPLLLGPRNHPAYQSTQTRLLLGFSLGPLAVTLMISLATGMYLYAKWATPYFSLLSVLLLYWHQPRVTNKHVKWMVITACSIIAITALGRATYLTWGPSWTGKARPDAYFPGQVIANKVSALWKKRSSRPFTYIAGSHYLAANIAVYSTAHPKPYMAWSHQESAWASDKQLKKAGAMFAWWTTPSQKPGIPHNIAKRFPAAEFLGNFRFQKSTHIKYAAIIIGIAYLPPSQTYSYKKVIGSP